jgi:VCBS repeat protein/FG-GAP repeat protein
VIGSRLPVVGLPTCAQGECDDTFNPFRGTSVAVADLDDDGRLDLAVTTPTAVVVNAVTSSSTMLGHNVHPVGEQAHFNDLTGALPSSLDTLPGDIVLLGDVVGGPAPDLVVVSRSAGPGASAVQVVENLGVGTTWRIRTTETLPQPGGDERLQAHDATLADVDGDGDLDIVLLTDASPGGGRALRILRNRGAAGFSTELIPLLPETTSADALDGASLAVGDLDGDGGLGIVIGRTTDSASGGQTRIILRDQE